MKMAMLCKYETKVTVTRLSSSMVIDASFTLNIHDTHNAHIPQSCQFPVLPLERGIHSLYQSLCHESGCSVDSKGFHTPVSSTLQSDFCPQYFLSDSIHTILC